MTKIINKLFSILIVMILVIVLTYAPNNSIIKTTVYADNYEYAWFPVNQVKLSQLSFESHSHSYSYHFDCVGANGVGNDYAFAPFTGKIVFITNLSNNNNCACVGFQSLDKVHWADGSLDYMTVWFMHGSNAGTLSKGQVISQGTNFYKMGSVGTERAHYDIGVSRGKVNTPTDQSGHGVGNYCGCGSDYPYDAFFLNRAKTQNIVNAGKLVGRFVGGSNNKSNWSGLWKNLNTTPQSPYIKITNASKPEGTLTPGKSFGIKGRIEAYPKIEAVFGGVYNADGTYFSDDFYYQEFPGTTTYDLSKKFDEKLIFNNLSVGYYKYIIWGRYNNGVDEKLIDSSFQVGDPAPVYPGIPKLNISKTSFLKDEEIKIWFNPTDNAEWYYMSLYRNGELYKDTGVDTTISLKLPVGDYVAYVSANNSFGNAGTDNVKFTVREKDFTITFNSNGGNVSPTSKTVTYNQTYGDLPTPTRTGYTFSGWFTEANGGTQITSGTTVNITSNQTLYAHWKANEYTLKINPNGGTYGNSTSAVENSPKLIYNSGNWWTIGKAVRTGYTLTGYFTEASGGTKVYDANGEALNSTFWKDRKYINAGNLNVYAQWTANQYNVKLIYNDGTDKSETIKVSYDGKYSGLKNPSRTGYNFNGWFTSEDGGTQISVDTKVNITAEQTLYAHWSKDKIMITFDAVGGTAEGSTKLITYDNKYGVLPNAEKNGYTFNGWYLDKEYKSKISESDIVKITANQSVYAKWNLRQYTVTFDGNGGTPDVKVKRVVYGKNYGVLPEAVLENDKFVGWFTADGTEIKSDDIVKLEKDVTVYAKWQSEMSGDINLDGVIDADDAILLQDYLLGRKSLTKEQGRKADMTGDNVIDAFDLVAMRSEIVERNGK